MKRNTIITINMTKNTEEQWFAHDSTPVIEKPNSRIELTREMRKKRAFART
jgi:hypothetical protein